MIVDVSWDGVNLVQGAQAREDAGGWFVELEQPMPVGTRLRLSGETEADVRVARVHEGLGAGMLVKPDGAVTSAAKPAAPTAKPAEDEATAKPAESAVAATAPSPDGAAEAEAKEPDDGGSGAGGGGKRDRRRKRKPTV